MAGRIGLPPPAGCGTCDAADLPSVPGAYALLILLRRSVELPARCRAGHLPPGRYVYFGSARGGGGIRARCRRHLDSEKTLRWHVDRLTRGARPGDVRALAFPDDGECGLVRRLRTAGGLATPVDGFGNSDCRTCPAHLFEVGDAVLWERIVDTLRQEGEN